MWYWIYTTVLYISDFIQKLILSDLHFRNTIVYFALFRQQKYSSKTKSQLSCCTSIFSDTALFRLWMNLCFWTNLVSQWFNDPFIKRVTCFVPNESAVWMNQLNEWFSDKTAICCHLLAVSVSFLKYKLSHLKGVIWCDFKFSFLFKVLQAVHA